MWYQLVGVDEASAALVEVLEAQRHVHPFGRRQQAEPTELAAHHVYLGGVGGWGGG
jgi:hypothetical protein